MQTSEETTAPTYPDNAFANVAFDVDADNPPWGLPLAVLTWFLSVLLLLLVPLVVSLPYLLTHYSESGSLTPEALLADKTLIFLNLIGVIPAHVLTIGLVWAVATRFGKYPIRKVIGWSWSPRFGLWASVGIAILLMGAGLIISSLFGGQPTDIDKIILSSRLNACTTAFLATATAPLVEELVYRGILYSALRRALGMTGSVVIVMGVFTIVHAYQYWPNFGVLSAILLLSFVLTLVRALTGRLLPCYIIHLIFNGIQSLYIVLTPYLPNADKILQRRSTGEILLHLFGFHL